MSLIMNLGRGGVVDVVDVEVDVGGGVEFSVISSDL